RPCAPGRDRYSRSANAEENPRRPAGDSEDSSPSCLHPSPCRPWSPESHSCACRSFETTCPESSPIPLRCAPEPSANTRRPCPQSSARDRAPHPAGERFRLLAVSSQRRFHQDKLPVRPVPQHQVCACPSAILLPRLDARLPPATHRDPTQPRELTRCAPAPIVLLARGDSVIWYGVLSL